MGLLRPRLPPPPPGLPTPPYTSGDCLSAGTRLGLWRALEACRDREEDRRCMDGEDCSAAAAAAAAAAMAEDEEVAVAEEAAAAAARPVEGSGGGGDAYCLCSWSRRSSLPSSGEMGE